jgi:methylglutaconyl-CoA hydratase
MEHGDEPLVRSIQQVGIAQITLNSPHNRNALSRRLLLELAAALDAAAEDPSIRVVVLTGAGPVFCAGADLKEQLDGHGPGPVSLADVLQRVLAHRCPVVARVNGPARAGGLGLLAACDIVVGLTSAEFAFSEIRIGVVPAMIAVPVLMRMNITAAHEYFLTGELFDGRRAVEVGLFNRAVSHGDLDMAVDAYTSALSRGGPSAMAATKQLTRVVPGREVSAVLEEMLELSSRHFASAEGQEGISAFREKRDPSWLST